MRVILLFALAAAALGMPSATLASAIRPAPPQPPALIFGLDQSFDYAMQADTDDFGGDLATYGSETTLSLTKLYTRTRANVALGYGIGVYDFDTTGPLDEYHNVSLRVDGNHRFAQTKWGAFGVAGLRFSGSFEGSALWEGRTGLIGFGPSYSFSRRLTVALGLSALDSPERDVRFFPLVFVDWQISDDWRLEVLQGVELSYALDEDWVAFLKIGVDQQSIRLGTQAVPGTPVSAEPVLEDFAVNLGSGVEYRPIDAVFVRGALGANVYRELTLREQERDRVEDTLGPALTVEISAGVRF
ncbi:MAG: hypothetical protein ACFB21_00235 [Opitutales bacterium]